MATQQASNYLENKIIDHLFRSGTLAKPTGLWVALFTAAPSDAAGGTEVTGGGYVRVNLPPLDSNWLATQGGTSGVSSGTSGVTSNAVVITYPTPSATWGTITHIGIFDASTAGNLLVWDALNTSRPILNGDPAPSFAPSALTITVA
jgi:hypothetical protein